MLDTKMFEVRDSATRVPIIVCCVKGALFSERMMLRSAGWGTDTILSDKLVFMLRADGEQGYTPIVLYNLNDRTFHVALKYISEHFDELHNGDVIDVEFILGETEIIKTAEWPAYIE